MMEYADVLRWAHVIGASVLLGTGAGIAFFMLMATRTGDAKIVAHTASTVVMADWLFTASAVVLQPITGILLASAVGWDLSEGWIVVSLALYFITGAFWLPVVWIQLRMRDIARAAYQQGNALPDNYYSLFQIWFVCGFPAFAAVLGIFWLMLTRPDLSF